MGRHTVPGWAANVEYRIKPEPKPDVETYVLLDIKHVHRNVSILIQSNNDWTKTVNGYSHNPNPTVKFIFDGETGKLKGVEMIKENS
jgi:hypothetical protein